MSGRCICKGQSAPVCEAELFEGYGVPYAEGDPYRRLSEAQRIRIAESVAEVQRARLAEEGARKSAPLSRGEVLSELAERERRLAVSRAKV